jgi:hypothetical protein
MRRALGLRQGSSPSGQVSSNVPHPQRRQFVRDGDVPVEVLHSPDNSSRVNQLAAARKAQEAQTTARVEAERMLAEARHTIHDLQTKLGHERLARDEAVQRVESTKREVEQELAAELEAERSLRTTLARERDRAILGRQAAEDRLRQAKDARKVVGRPRPWPQLSPLRQPHSPAGAGGHRRSPRTIRRSWNGGGRVGRTNPGSGGPRSFYGVALRLGDPSEWRDRAQPFPQRGAPLRHTPSAQNCSSSRCPAFGRLRRKSSRQEGNLSMRQRDLDDDDSLPVMVPRSDKTLVAISAKRVRRLREHLIQALQELRTAKHSKSFASPVRPEPTGFAAAVARTACSTSISVCRSRPRTSPRVGPSTITAQPSVTARACSARASSYRTTGGAPHASAFIARNPGLPRAPSPEAGPRHTGWCGLCAPLA